MNQTRTRAPTRTQTTPPIQTPICNRAERIVIYMLTGLLALIIPLGFANHLGLVIGNPTNSVPPGLYRIAAPDRAGYVTFCLGTRHRGDPFYPLYCSPDDPGGIRILKRITTRHEDGSLTVSGDTPDALDSRLLGPVRSDDIRGWWTPLIRIPE